jgi:hypothetical protein
MDSLIAFHECRTIAMRGSTPFVSDPLKKPFHLAMMDVPGLLYTTLLKAGDTLVAGHLEVSNGRQVHLIFMAHNPTLAKQSPGTLHLLLLCRRLLADGYELFDLTPGAGGYKAELSNDADEVHVLTVYGSPVRRREGDAAARVAKATKNVLARYGKHSGDAVRWRRQAQELGVSGLTAAAATRLTRWMRPRRHDVRIYRLDLSDRRVSQPLTASASASDSRLPDSQPPILRDAFAHLVAYRRPAGGPTRSAFLERALERFHDGLHAYSALQRERLAFLGWLAEPGSAKSPSDDLDGFELPADSALLMFATPLGGQASIARAGLAAMIRDAASVPSTRGIYAAVADGDHAARRLLEQSGFIPQAHAEAHGAVAGDGRTSDGVGDGSANAEADDAGQRSAATAQVAPMARPHPNAPRPPRHQGAPKSSANVSAARAKSVITGADPS